MITTFTTNVKTFLSKTKNGIIDHLWLVLLWYISGIGWKVGQKPTKVDH